MPGQHHLEGAGDDSSSCVLECSSGSLETSSVLSPNSPSTQLATLQQNASVASLEDMIIDEDSF